jgi:hypothetical protein
VTASPVVWRELRPLTAELLRCDYPGCGEQADTIHLVPWCDATCEAALLACPAHDPGGYGFSAESLVDEWIDWRAHLLDKLDATDQRRAVGGWFLLAGRLEELTRPVVHVTEPTEPAPEPSEAPTTTTVNGTTDGSRPRSPRRRRAPTPPRELGPGEQLTRYGRVALVELVDEVRSAPEGSRNDTLNRKAFRAGQLVAAGQIAEDVARDELVDAAVAAGLGRLEARSTVKSGLAAGMKDPAQLEDRP